MMGSIEIVIIKQTPPEESWIDFALLLISPSNAKKLGTKFCMDPFYHASIDFILYITKRYLPHYLISNFAYKTSLLEANYNRHYLSDLSSRAILLKYRIRY